MFAPLMQTAVMMTDSNYATTQRTHASTRSDAKTHSQTARMLRTEHTDSLVNARTIASFPSGNRAVFVSVDAAMTGQLVRIEVMRKLKAKYKGKVL